MMYDCMTEEELALWRAGAENLARQTGYVTEKPCSDCPLSFRLQAYEAGTCRLPRPAPWHVVEKRRAYKAEWMRMRRESTRVAPASLAGAQ